LKAYELSLDPEKLQEFLSTWESASDHDLLELDHFADHLTKASEVLDRLSKAEAAGAGPQSSGPALEALVNFRGDFVYKSHEWETEYPASRTFFDVVPEWHQEEIERGLAELSAPNGAQSRLFVCNDETGSLTLMILLHTIAPISNEQNKRVHVRLLKSTWSEQLRDFFSNQYKLTTAELSVFELIVAGLPFVEIVNKLGKSSETIKTQSKAIYSKIGVSGREAAVRFALQIRYLMPNDLAGTVEQIRSLESQLIEIGGRKVGITRKGQLSGQPFILLHGIISGYEFGARFEEELRRANLCAICVERPGYGRSDNPASHHTILEEWLEMFPSLLEKLGLQEACLVTHASGGTYVAATQGRHPGLSPRGICISTGMPNFSGAGDERFPVSHRFLFWCLRNSPASLAFYLKVYAAYLNRDQNYGNLIRRNHARSASDSAVLNDPQNLKCAIDGYKLVERPKMIGFIGDLKCLWENMHRWEFSHAADLVKRIKSMVLNDPNWNEN